jgi:hypothetical protein
MLQLIVCFTLLNNFHFPLDLNLFSAYYLNHLMTYLDLIVKLIAAVKIKIMLNLTTDSKYLINLKLLYFL